MDSLQPDLKFEASSADEALARVRETLGEKAEIVAVRQVEGKGLARFLMAPRLEIVASVHAKSELEAPAASPRQLAHKIVRRSVRELSANGKPTDRLSQILLQAGFDSVVLERLKAGTDWAKLSAQEASRSFEDIARRLRLDYEALAIPPVTRTMAFIGGAGVGKTTALCKYLACEVFFARHKAQLIRLGDGSPNADEALLAYCEMMGVPVLSGPDEVSPDATLLVDTAGLALDVPEERLELAARLDEMGVQTRLWVVNCAYENLLIDKSLEVAQDLRATHSVYTHLDEVVCAARLWRFALSGAIPPLFGSTGPAIAHCHTDDIAQTLLEKTFGGFLSP